MVPFSKVQPSNCRRQHRRSSTKRVHWPLWIVTITVSIVLLLTTNDAWAGITIDATTSTHGSSATSSISTPPFSTQAGSELLLAFVATDYISGGNTTVTGISGAGLTWTLVKRTNVQKGTAEIWRAFATAQLSNVAVTATLSQSVLAAITVVTYLGVDTGGTNGSGAIGATAGANSGQGGPSASLVTTRNGSWVFGVGNDYDNAIARTPDSGQSIVSQYLTPLGDTYWVQMQNAPTSLAGTTVKIDDTVPTTDRFNLSIAEVLAPASGTGYTVSGSIAPLASPAVSGVEVALTGGGSENTTTNSSGNYSFSGLTNGAYAVTPSFSGYTFTPASQNLTLNDGTLTGINFAGSSVPTWSISGSVTPAAAGITVTLSGMSSGSTVTDSSGNYTFGGLVNGNYALTPSQSGYTFTPASLSVTINGANLMGQNFTRQQSVNGALAIDVNVSHDNATATTTIASPVFSTSVANELLLAFVESDYISGASVKVNSIAGGSLLWTLVQRTNVQSGTAEIWRAFAPNPITGVTVTATLSQAVEASITVLSLSGVDPTGTNGSGAIGAIGSANADPGAPLLSLVTTRNGSWVFGVGNDWDRAVARTPAGGQSLVHQYLSPSGDTYWVQMQNGFTAHSGTDAFIYDTAPSNDRYNLSAVEVLPSVAGNPPPPTVGLIAPSPGSTVALTMTVVASASDADYGVQGVQFLVDGNNIGAEVTTPPYAVSWDTTTVSPGQHVLTAIAHNNAQVSTVSSPLTVNVDNSANPAVIGSWSSVYSLPTVAVNLVLLHNNRVLFYQDGTSPTVWDYVNNVFYPIATNANLFCSGHASLADGRILMVGGYGGDGNNLGIANAEVFDPQNNAFTAIPSMSYRRWYPTATTLSDGRVLVTAGWQTTAHTNAGIPEVYDPNANNWTKLTAANNPFETYPFMYVLPNGNVIHVGGSEYPTITESLSLTSDSWTTIDPRQIDGGSSAMYLPNKILKAGSATDSQGTGPSSSTAFTLDLTQQSPFWQQVPSMAFPRSFLNLTELPDGTVLATGGETDKNGGNIANAVYAAELWNPQTTGWSTMASMHTPREYHSTALLLPDGRVMQSGMGADFGNVPNETSAEFFSPPYLFKGPRPSITSTPAQVHYGQNFTITTPDAASISSVVLIRAGAATHFFDQATRFVPVSLGPTTGGLTITAPPNGNAAPPGYYMLFIVNNGGVPSVASFVQVGP